LKQYKEPPQLSFSLFIFVHFFILIEAMSESALEKLRQEARKKKLERKAKAFRRKQIEKENGIGSINWSNLCKTTSFTCTYSRGD
jgi:hypothetical protein